MGASNRPNGFWVRVDRNGPIVPYVGTPCWLWTGDRSSGGYGRYRIPGARSPGAKGRTYTFAHRFAWTAFNGPIPEGQWVLHRCDTPLCVNPDHLFLGDNDANVADMHAKGRARKARGEDAPTAKLTPDAVRDIRAARSQTPPVPLKTLAARYGVSLVAVSKVARGKDWKHVV